MVVLPIPTTRMCTTTYAISELCKDLSEACTITMWSGTSAMSLSVG